MARPLNPRQEEMLAALATRGTIKKGDGYHLATARALATRALCELEERRDKAGKVYFWRVRSTRPVATQEAKPETVATSAPRPAGAFVIRVGARNPATEKVTFTEVRHVADMRALSAELETLGVPIREQIIGSGGTHTGERQKLVWRSLRDGALREFVCGGEVYRLRPSSLGGWEALHTGTEEVVTAGNDPDEVERRAREDAAAFHRALRS